MSNLSRLQAVSSSLDTAIQKVENLPEAGSGDSGGGSVETCTVNLQDSYGVATWYYTDENMMLQTCTGSRTVTIPINTLLTYEASGPYSVINNGNCVPIINYNNYGVVHIYGGSALQVYNQGGGA